MGATYDRLVALQPAIINICKISGTPEISIGVTHNNGHIYSFNPGHRDVEVGEPVDKKTIFQIMSMSKAFTGAALLIYYHALIQAHKKQGTQGLTADANSPFKQLPFIFSPHMDPPDSIEKNQSYGIGWAWTQLPITFGAMSPNGLCMKSKQTVGHGSD